MPDSARLVADLRAAGIAAVISGAGPSVIALVTGEFDLERWRRPGFEVAEVAVCTTGRANSPPLTCATRSRTVAQADDVRLLLKAITGCARCDEMVCEPDINGGGLKKPSPLPP